MSLPWTHHTIPVVRNIPCDIDDMTEILTADDGSYTPFENGPFGFGRFDVGQLRRDPLNSQLATSSDTLCAASRRSEDPGVIELSTVTLPSYPPEDPNRGKNVLAAASCSSRAELVDQFHECSDVGTFRRGEASLRCFEEVQKCKRRKVDQARSCARSQYISVKINSSSSRSSICPSKEVQNVPDGKISYPRLLEATLPLEVQNGRFLSSSKAPGIAGKLGSYNWRHALGPTNQSGKNANRISVGRTRLMWTEKSPPDQPQRVFFTSLLTGSRVEGGTQKRPREIKVTIKVNGNVVGEVSEVQGSLSPSSSHSLSISSVPSFCDAKARDPRAMSQTYVYPSMECVLDSDQLVRSILRDPGESRIELRKNAESKSTIPHVVPAQIECVPDNNGLICVLCTKPGIITASSVHDTLNIAARQDSRLCTVCWSPSDDETGPVKECMECGVLVHPQCCFDRGEPNSTSSHESEQDIFKWKCGICCKKRQEKQGVTLDSESNAEAIKKRRRKSRPPPWLKDSHVEPLASKRLEDFPDSPEDSKKVKCALCPYSGGAMSLVRRGRRLSWIHEVCRIWAPGESSRDGTLIVTGGQRYEACALCGANEDTSTSSSSKTRTLSSPKPFRSLVKCAAMRCQVYFHPMCALLIAKLSTKSREIHQSYEGENEDENALKKAKDEDIDSSTRFALTALTCEATKGKIGKDPGAKHTLTVPVAFCGIHNPKRETSLYGMYPGGKYMVEKTVRIPSFKK